MAGIEGKQVVLLLEDHQFVDQQFLELVNSLLSAGEVPGLYTHEELEPLLAPIKDQASEAGFRGTIVQYYASSMCSNFEVFIIGLRNRPLLSPRPYLKALTKAKTMMSRPKP